MVTEIVSFSPQNIIPPRRAGRTSILLGLALVWVMQWSPAAGGAEPPTGEVEHARSLEAQAARLDREGKFQEALAPAQEALALRERTLGPAHADTAQSLNTLGEIYEDLGDFAECERCFRRALEVREKLLGENHADTALSVSNLGDLFFKKGDFARAEPLWQRALDIRTRLFGPDHLETAKSLNNLAVLFLQSGDLARAEPLFRRTFRIWERDYGPEHPRTAVVLANLAILREHLGDFAEARRLQERALAINEKNVGPEHPLTLRSLDNLAVLASKTEDFARAESLWRRVLRARERDLGETHPLTLRIVFNLASLAFQQGDFAGAVPLHRRALAGREKALGERAPDTSVSLSGLAHALGRLGQLAEAERLARRALAVQETVLGPAHIDTATTLRTLAEIVADAGRHAEAVAFETRARRAEESLLANVLSFTSEEQRLEFQANAIDPYALPARLGDAALLAEAALRTKGVVLDSLLEDRLVAEASADPAQRERIERARALRRELTKLALDAPADASEAGLKKRDAESARLSTEIEALEAAMAREVAGLGRARRALAATVAQVQAALPAGSALVEFVRYVSDPEVSRSEVRYGAVIFSPDRPPAWVALGSAEPIERQLHRYQEAVRAHDGRGGNGDAALTLEETLGALHALVWAPIARVLPPATNQVLIGPDGELNFLSFATLLTPDEQFLGERLRLSYVSSGRDVLPLSPVGQTESAKDRKDLIVFANPKLGQSESTPAADGPLPLATARTAETWRGFEKMKFSPLPGAEAEGVALLRQAKAWGWTGELFAGGDATEYRLRALRSPWVLHLATHGFFLTEADASTALPLRNPMRRSGLALAGADATLRAWERGEASPRTSDDDGIVTAEEVATLDLRGTWLVALSACESGVGEARAGEGVLGLRRGFARAGARHLLMSLWPVPDRETAALMLDFYADAQKSGDPAKALAETQRAHLTRLRREQGLAAAVRFSGAFILSSQGR